MQIGQVIRKYRKSKGMTQEEMANRLGVTAPAVNKWENGNSMPDITLLAPIARLLGITLDTLLTYQEDLTEQEVNELIETLREKLETETFEETFQWSRQQMEQYPNCEHLLLYMSVILNGACIEKEIEEEQYEDYLLAVDERLLGSSEEAVRTTAADILHGYYVRKEQYEKAEEYLEYFSSQNPEKKRKQAVIYARSGRLEEAYRIYEELLYSESNTLYITFHGMFSMCLKEQDMEKAEYMEEKMIQLIRTFELGQYYESSTRLDLMMAKKDTEGTLACAEEMAESVGEFGSWCKAPLYEHMTFKELSGEFMDKMKGTIGDFFGDEDLFGYMKGNKDWEALKIKWKKKWDNEKGEHCRGEESQGQQ